MLPALIEEFAGSNASAGIWNGVLVALWAAMQFLCSPIIGSLSDRYGRRPVILISTAGLAADWVLMALAPNLWWLAVGRLLGGITSSSFTAVYAYMADITPPEGRARAYGLVGAAFGLGFVAGPALGGVLGEFDPRLPFWVAAGMSALAFLYGLLVLPESLPEDRRMAFSWRRANPLGALRLLRSHPELAGLASVNFLLYFAHHVFSAVYVLYAGHRYGIGSFEVGLMLAAAGVLDMAVQGALVGPVTKRLGDRTTMLVGLVGGAFGLFAMGVAPTPLAVRAGAAAQRAMGPRHADLAGDDDAARVGKRTGPAAGRQQQRRQHRRGGIAAVLRLGLCAVDRGAAGAELRHRRRDPAVRRGDGRGRRPARYSRRASSMSITGTPSRTG